MGQIVSIKAMGRFVHEAIAVDPQTGIVYLTEDLVTCGFYRFLPTRTRRLGAGGRLQMLAVKNQPQFNTTTQQKEGLSLPVTWVDIQILIRLTPTSTTCQSTDRGLSVVALLFADSKAVFLVWARFFLRLRVAEIESSVRSGNTNQNRVRMVDYSLCC